MVDKTIRFIWDYFKINLQGVMEYRLNFIIQSTFMLINDVMWLLFWWLFFTKFNVVNDWTLNDMIVLYVVTTASFGLLQVFTGNFLEISRIIKEGKLDFYLTFPKDELSHMLVSYMDYDGFGDLIFAIGLTIIFIPLIKWPLLITLIIASSFLLIAFSIILGSIGFFMSSSTEISKAGTFGMMVATSYPFNIFTGITKFLLLTIMPAGFISGVPVQLLRVFNIKWFLLMLIVTVIFCIIAVVLFKTGIKRYESGNLINVRV